MAIEISAGKPAPPILERGVFEDEWPALAARLNRRLSRSCPDPFEREDVVQETGLRLFRMWERVDGRPLWPLVLTIALNLLRDAHRAWQEPSMELPPELPSTSDVERTGIARLELALVKDALERLSVTHRAVLLAELGMLPPEGLSPAATKMSRMRARRRLSQLLEGGISTLAVAPLKLQSWALSCRTGVQRRLCSVTAQIDITPYAAGVVAIVAGISGSMMAAGPVERVPMSRVQPLVTQEIRWLPHAVPKAQHNATVLTDRLQGGGSLEDETGLATAGDSDDHYEVPLPGGSAFIAAEGNVAGNRFWLGGSSLGSCTADPSDSLCAVSTEPYASAELAVRYGEHSYRQRVEVDGRRPGVPDDKLGVN